MEVHEIISDGIAISFYILKEDPLEEDMATHSSIFAWRFPWIERPGGL